MPVPVKYIADFEAFNTQLPDNNKNKKTVKIVAQEAYSFAKIRIYATGEIKGPILYRGESANF